MSRPGGFVNGPFGSDLLTSELTDSGVPVIYVQDIKEDEYRRLSNAHVTEDKANELLVCNVRTGDVLVAKVGDPPGIAAIYHGLERAVVTQDVIRIRPADDIVPQFLASLLNSSVGTRAIRRIIIEGTRARVSLTEFKRLLLSRPSHREQELIADRISITQRTLCTLTTDVAKTKTIKHGLMHDLLTGRVRVKVAESQELSA
jgi:type I restriction enzyme S subunit